MWKRGSERERKGYNVEIERQYNPLTDRGVRKGDFLTSVKHCLDNLVAISAFLSLHDNTS